MERTGKKYRRKEGKEISMNGIKKRNERKRVRD